MSLPTNPFATLISKVSDSISQATNEGAAKFQSGVSQLSKTNLDSKISSMAGELGSGLNGATSGIKNALNSAGFGEAAGKFSALEGAAGKSLAGLKSLAGSTSAVKADITSSLSKFAGGDLGGGLKSLAGAIGKSAGSLNDILSLRRGSNIPAGADFFKNQSAAIQLDPGAKDDWRVRINGPWTLFNSPIFARLQETGGVVFPYLPNITVSTKADYQKVDLTHSNYPYYSYKSSTVDDIQISGEFTAETETDAAYWIAATTFFKTATKMFFGKGNNAGNPPIICHLYGYGASVFDKVPVIITNFSVDLKEDVNYVKCNSFDTNTWVPVVSTVSITCVPVYSREALREFNLQSYASGKMVGPGGVGFL